jgi:hypothetical protein
MSGSQPPAAGSVIRYTYLWADEDAACRDEGRKDRPALVLVLAVRAQGSDTRVLVVAVTHTPPREPGDAVPFPPAERRRIGLDELPAWIVTTEANAFTWPGPDIRPVPGRPPGTFTYGRISPALLTQVARSYLTNRNRQRGRLVVRTE